MVTNVHQTPDMNDNNNNKKKKFDEFQLKEFFFSSVIPSVAWECMPWWLLVVGV